ncbi:hypothetical protein [Caldimonas brevitalea]|uniref:Uncharacterized protein n=1 Tax=Caldimonas brevitalea TaxID=413882 RepID=A0A0G3BPV0_9BURK|nr:hypothetical protein [Caldimonas brevitalea]AKJ30013.1 hypothetical protein AAW51_3322 [Caldimonas brevitalea]
MRCLPVSLTLVFCVLTAAAVQAQGQVYRCPGNNFTNSISPKDADARGCKVVDGGNVTIVQTRPPGRPDGKGGDTKTASVPASAARPADSKVDPSEQRARDSDARRILEAELRKEEEQLAALQKDYNNGEPERRGDERNYQKYLDRVAEMKATIARKESDIASIRRELGKLPAAQ